MFLYLYWKTEILGNGLFFSFIHLFLIPYCFSFLFVQLVTRCLQTSASVLLSPLLWEWTSPSSQVRNHLIYLYRDFEYHGVWLTLVYLQVSLCLSLNTRTPSRTLALSTRTRRTCCSRWDLVLSQIKCRPLMFRPETQKCASRCTKMVLATHSLFHVCLTFQQKVL